MHYLEVCDAVAGLLVQQLRVSSLYSSRKVVAC